MSTRATKRQGRPSRRNLAGRNRPRKRFASLGQILPRQPQPLQHRGVRSVRARKRHVLQVPPSLLGRPETGRDQVAERVEEADPAAQASRTSGRPIAHHAVASAKIAKHARPSRSPVRV